MQSSLNWESLLSGGRAARLAKQRLGGLAIVAAAALFALAMLLLWRRIAGAIHEPLPTSGIVAAGIILGFIAGAAHWIGRISPAKNNAALLSDIALSLALFAAAATLSLPGTSTVGLIAFWSILLLEEGWAWLRRTGFQPVVTDQTVLHNRDVEAPAEPSRTGFQPVATDYKIVPQIHEPRPSEIVKLGLETVETLPPEEVTQQLTRSTAADGTEELAGWLRISFAAGQRTGSVHVAFCPPFARTPELSVEQIDGPEARLKTTQALPYGARLDLKLHSASESPASVVLQFAAWVEKAGTSK
jgi:hypothetical protein